MYNEDCKNEFIKEYSRSEKSKRFCMELFDTVGKYEMELGKDIYTMSYEELEYLMRIVERMGANRKAQRTLILKEYSRFCILKKCYDNASPAIFRYNLFNIDRVKTHYVSSPKHLQSYLDLMFRSESKHTIDDAYRCYCWLAFGGMKEERIPFVKTTDVDLSNMLVEDGESAVEIYEYARDAFYNCKNSLSFEYENANYNNKITRARVPGDELLRGVRAGVSTKKTLRNVLTRCCREAEKKIGGTFQFNYRSIYMSGIFYRINSMESDGAEIDMASIAEDFMDGKDYWFDRQELTNDKAYKLDSVICKYEERYAEWKQAFGIYRIN